MKRLEVFLLPLDGTPIQRRVPPNVKFTGTHLSKWHIRTPTHGLASTLRMCTAISPGSGSHRQRFRPCYAVFGCHCPISFTEPTCLLVSTKTGSTARVIWLCACVRYWPNRGLLFERATCSAQSRVVRTNNEDTTPPGWDWGCLPAFPQPLWLILIIIALLAWKMRCCVFGTEHFKE